MNNTQAEDRRLAAILGDAAWATIWAALVLFVLTLASYIMFVFIRFVMPGAVARLWGVDESVMSILYIAAIGIMKLASVFLATISLALWLWQRRLEDRLEREAYQAWMLIAAMHHRDQGGWPQ